MGLKDYIGIQESSGLTWTGSMQASALPGILSPWIQSSFILSLEMSISQKPLDMGLNP